MPASIASRRSLRTRLGIALAVLLVLVSLGLALLLASYSRTVALDLARENVGGLAEQMARELSLGMDRFAREVELQAGRPAFSDPSAKPPAMRRQLEAIQKVYPEFAHLSVVDIASARVVAATGGIFEGGDAAGRPVFEQGRKGLFVADVHDAVRLANLLPRPASGEPLRFLDVAAPILGPDGRPLRVLGAHLSWQWSSSLQQRILGPVEARRGVQILLVDTHGAVVLPPDASIAVGTPLQRVLGPAAADPRAAWADGTEYLLAEAPTFASGAFTGLGWRVVVRQPMAVVLAQSNRLRNLLLAGGLGLGLLAAGLGWLIAGRLARPVSQLARAASELALGSNLQSASEEELHEVAVVREAFQRVTGEALARAERLLRELDATYERAPAGLCVVGVDLRYVRANRVWSDAFVAVGQPVAGTALHDGPLPELEQAIAAALQTGDPQALELEGDRQDPHRVWQTQLAPLRGGDGAVAGVSVVATDVTGLRQAERALRLADERKTQFISMLAHELRNPLAPVINALEVLKRQPTEAQAARMRQMMERQVRHMARLIDDLLDVSRVNLGKVEMRFDEVSLADICERAVESVRHSVESRRQVLRLDIDPALPPLQGDAARLEQVVCNLLSNASKYGRDGGSIALVAEPVADHVLVTVQDDGRGIPPEFLPYVFELFAQGEVPIDRAEGGLGIGLALVRSLVQLHGGEVEALSDGPGTGSRFVVSLPVQPPGSRRGGGVAQDGHPAFEDSLTP